MSGEGDWSRESDISSEEESFRLRWSPFYQPYKNKTYSSNVEYFKDLQLWLNHAQFWSAVSAAFPYYLASCQISQQGVTGPTLSQNFPPHNRSSGSPLGTQDQNYDGVECKIPALWKRILAESIDFVILFCVKLAMTFIAVDFFDMVDLEKLDFDNFQKETKIEYKAFLQMTHDIIILELIHRVIVCAFETFCLQGGANGRIGGATPGKSFMGLRVIKCDTSIVIPRGSDEVLLVKPGSNLGLGSSFARALLKNLIMTFLIPAGFAFLFQRQNRTSYDMICNTIVVEDPIVPHRSHRE